MPSRKLLHLHINGGEISPGMLMRKGERDSGKCRKSLTEAELDKKRNITRLTHKTTV